MTEISFYFNVRSRELALCQLVGKALAQGKSVCILTGSEASTQALDRLLWETPATGFLPHCLADAIQATQTPIILDHRVELLRPRDVLFNWTDHVAPRFSEFARLIEIVDSDDELRLAARQRWAAYKQLGHTPTATDMSSLTASRSD
ncbi:DNA polymerase III subunit chi [Chitinibacter bivalviorum]|uniref:DNA polymerase III subunit chi n=1 Tax=Chitinibacter bivalviorum TaxID=2739434 RepID=A0A7H9BLV0_9NEIS|nr:DNA polymerase III subunit chi [Chitinibacter bivalviorum]QLG89650.1 DNA polymerase III subunit chi [Chitinibacter bivalviorum]